MPKGGTGTKQQETGTLKRESHLLWSQVQHPGHASRPQEGLRDNRNDSANRQATASIISRYGKLHGDLHPHLSHHTEPLRAMLKKDNMFHWEEQQTWSLQKIKALIAKVNETPLRYYDRTLPVTVQVDASLRGLGACLIQKHNWEDQPIAFASKSLMDAETRYANIERELLAIVFACQHFSTYLLGRSFIAESDHKPLEMIAM